MLTIKGKCAAGQLLESLNSCSRKLQKIRSKRRFAYNILSRFVYVYDYLNGKSLIKSGFETLLTSAVLTRHYGFIPHHQSIENEGILCTHF